MGSLVLVAIAWAAAAPPLRPAPPARVADAAGTYRLRGWALVTAPPAAERRVAVRADAVLEPGRGGGELLVTVGAEGATCRMVAALDGSGALAFAPGQRCALELRSPDARGRLEARLVSGRGRLRGDELGLELSCQVEGEVSVRAGGRVQVLGHDLDVPEAWAPVPVRGRADAAAEGHRDRSRAAAPAPGAAGAGR